MKRIIYGAPPSNTPAGGVKVIYKHSEILNRLGVESAIWHPGEDDFKCSWFNCEIKNISTKNLNPEKDLIILPEIWASVYSKTLKQLGFEYAIYVQNAYYANFNLDPKNKNNIEDAYKNAKFIMSISVDTSKFLNEIFLINENKIVMQRYSINNKIFRPGNKEKIITYMPRKMEQHSNRVVSLLSRKLPESWRIESIDNKSENEVAEILSRSIIFLAFSEFEGLPVPPVEAAMAGNIVIGYHGQGGKEYWNNSTFIEINQGDIQNFISNINKQIEKIDRFGIKIDEINKTIENLSNYFSKDNEELMIENMIKKVIET